MNQKTLIIKAAECAVKEMIIKGTSECLVLENHTPRIISWYDVLIGLRELESEEEE